MKQHWNISTPSYESDLLNDSLKVSPWCGHRNFVYDLFNYLEPHMAIELGTHYGCSFFAMCQSIKDHSLSQTTLYAVDTWKGDEQAGFYDESVWQLVNQTKERFFKSVNSQFLRMLFDDAASLFENETFDVIHIDGLHTYDAISHDFNTWYPKLKHNGIMLFHDIASGKKYGSDKFWDEIKAKYPCHFEFTHSWGLGILFPKGDFLFQKLKEQNFNDKLLVYAYKATSEYHSYEVRDLTHMANERFEAIQKQSEMIRERDDSIKAQAALLEERYNAIQEQSEMIRERDNSISTQASIIHEKELSIQCQNQSVNKLKQDMNKCQTQLITAASDLEKIQKSYKELSEVNSKFTVFLNSNWFIKRKWLRYISKINGGKK